MAFRCFCRPEIYKSLKQISVQKGSNLFAFHNGIAKVSFINYLNRNEFHISSLRLKVETVSTPNFPESISEGDIKWIKNIGDRVTVDELIGEIETDKTSLPVVSQFDGILTELSVESGSKVSKGTKLCKIDVSAQGHLPTATVIEPKKDSGDILKDIKIQPKEIIPKPTAKKVPSETPTIMSGSTELDRIDSRTPLSRIRKTIAARLKASQNTSVMLTTFNEVDMSNAMELRSKLKDSFSKKYGVKLGFMSLFVSAAKHALVEMPVVNSVIEGNDIVSRNYIDVSVAVASPKGLVVPVIRNVHRMTVSEMEMAMVELAEKARKEQLAIEDMDGGTFTISNGGVFGSMMSTPIINPPQSAILGLHAIKDRPVAIDGKVEIRPIMYVALTYDHRIIDGREAVTFLNKIKSSMEYPLNMLVGI